MRGPSRKQNCLRNRKKIVNTHALKAAQLVEGYPETPFGAFEMISQHHGSKTGVGFDNNQPSQISPISIVFMVVESYVDLLMKKEEDKEFDFKTESTTLLNSYKKGFYKQAAAALLKLKPPK